MMREKRRFINLRKIYTESQLWKSSTTIIEKKKKGVLRHHQTSYSKVQFKQYLLLLSTTTTSFVINLPSYIEFIKTPKKKNSQNPLFS